MLSVVIAANNSERLLVPTLAALVGGAVAGLVREVILADAGSSDATVEIAELAGCVVLSSQAPLANRLKAAATRARGPWLLFVRPGFVPDADWIDAVIAFMQSTQEDTGPQRPAAVFRHGIRTGAAGSRIGALLASLAPRMAGRPSPDQGLLITKSRYARMEGHRAGVQDPEGDLLSRLGRRRIAVLDCGGRLPPRG